MAAFSLAEFDISSQDIQEYPSFQHFINLEDYENFKNFIFNKYIIGRSKDLDKQIQKNAFDKLTSLITLQTNIHLMRCLYILKYNNPIISQQYMTQTYRQNENYRRL